MLPLRSESERSDRIIFGEPSNSLTIPHYPLHEESSCGRFGTLRFTICTSFLQEAVPKCVFLPSKQGYALAMWWSHFSEYFHANKFREVFAIFIKRFYHHQIFFFQLTLQKELINHLPVAFCGSNTQ